MTAPDLPETCRWVSSVEEAAGTVAAGQIPVIHPSNNDRAKRWARVLDWYDPAAPAFPCGPGEGSAVVVSTNSAEALGQLAGAALGRPHHHVDTLTDTKLLPTAESVLVVMPAVDATLSALTPAWTLWEETGTRIGLLTGRDCAGMVFSLAKMLASRTTSRTAKWEPDLLKMVGLPPDIEQTETGRTVVLDGRTGRACWLGDSGGRVDQISALRGNWYATVLSAEGNAGHAWLDGGVLCGLSRPEEYDLAGREFVDGCIDDTCKLARNALMPPLHPHRLTTFVLTLLVPNAVAIGRGERYPSEVSLALDALEGYPAAVMGLTHGDVHTTSLETDVAAHLLHAGTPLGSASHDLSLGIARRGLPRAVLLLGDPDYAPPAAEGATVPAIEFDVETEVPVIVNGQHAVPALVVRGRALLAEPHPRAHVDDARADITDLLGRLRSWPSRLAEAELIEDVLADAQSPLTASFESRLDTMRAARMAASHEVATTIRHIQRLRELREPGLPSSPEPRLDELSGQWAIRLAALVVDGPDTIIDALTAGLTAHHQIARRAFAGPCDQCGAPCQRQHYASPLPVGNRTGTRCPRCGTLRSQPDGGSAVMLNAPRELHPGQPAAVEAIVDGAWGTTGLLCVQLRPTTADLEDAAVYYSDVAAGTTSFTLDVPADATLELRRICSVYACRFQVAVAHAWVPVVPDFDSATGGDSTSGETP